MMIIVWYYHLFIFIYYITNVVFKVYINYLVRPLLPD